MIFTFKYIYIGRIFVTNITNLRYEIQFRENIKLEEKWRNISEFKYTFMYCTIQPIQQEAPPTAAAISNTFSIIHMYLYTWSIASKSIYVYAKKEENMEKKITSFIPIIWILCEHIVTYKYHSVWKRHYMDTLFMQNRFTIRFGRIDYFHVCVNRFQIICHQFPRIFNFCVLT